jgi:hypothetical protein
MGFYVYSVQLFVFTVYEHRISLIYLFIKLPTSPLSYFIKFFDHDQESILTATCSDNLYSFRIVLVYMKNTKQRMVNRLLLLVEKLIS